MAEPEFEVDDRERVVRLARLIGHLRRLDVMIALHERKKVSASILAKAGLGENADVTYHLLKLADADAVRVAETRQGTRGAPQRFYQLTDLGREALRAAAVLGRKE